MRISGSQIKNSIGYLLIYFLILMNNSQMFYVVLEPLRFFIFTALIAVAGLILIMKHNSRRKTKPVGYSVAFCIGLLLWIVWLRLVSGGIGVEELVSMANPILLTAIVVWYNGETTETKYVNTVVFLSVISLICYTIGLILPDLLLLIFPNTYTSAWGIDANGMLFYTYISDAANRNSGFFSEPGLFQCILNSAVFILLFWKDRLYVKNLRRYYVSLAIIIVTIISSQSTTGYMSLGVIIIVWLLSKSSNKTRKRAMVFCLLLIGCFLIVDYVRNGEKSVISTVVLSKLIDDAGQFSLEAGTGAYRIGTIEECWKIFKENPWGVGYDVINQSLNEEYVAGVLVKTLAAWGIVPFLFMMTWIVYPFRKHKVSIVEFCVFMFMYINVTISQASMFYPTIVLIPLCVYRYSRVKR